MAQLQPFVSNVPIVVAKNLRFNDANNLLVTQMLPIGMNGTIVNDSPTTGYISRIGSILSNQIDLYNNVANTLASYQTSISALQVAVAALELSGTTVPNVNGYCYTGNAQSPITTVVQLMAQSTCYYNATLGTYSALALAVSAEGAGTLNSLPSFSSKAAMQNLSGWISNPLTIADSINNLWLSYLDSRTGITTALAAVTPVCSQVIIDFQPVQITNGFNIYFSGYSFIPTGYTNNGSTLVITDGLGGTTIVSLDIVARSATGAAALYVPISGTTLSPSVSMYTVQLNSAVTNSTLGLSCSKTIIKNTAIKSINTTIVGQFNDSISGSTSAINVVTGLSFSPGFVIMQAGNANTAIILGANTHYTTYTNTGAILNFNSPVSITLPFIINWVAYSQTG